MLELVVKKKDGKKRGKDLKLHLKEGIRYETNHNWKQIRTILARKVLQVITSKRDY
jgi:hypothetical protein